MNLIEMIDGAAEKSREKPMLVCDGRSFSYADSMASTRIAASRLAEKGIRPGDVIAVVSLNIPEFVIAMIAIWRVGAVIVPINHKLSAAESRYIINHSRAKLVLYCQALAENLDIPSIEVETMPLDGPGSCFTPDKVDATCPQQEAFLPDRKAPAQILYTSGTTGKPKGCVHSHASVVNTATLSAVAFSMVPTDRTLIAMPIWHAAPLNNFVMTTLFVGGTLVLLREYAPQTFLQSLQDDHITVYFGAPISFALPLSLPQGPGTYDFSAIRALIYGGGPISADLAQRLSAAYRTDRFYQIYGMTETGPTGTLLYPHEQISKAGSIGRSAMPGADMRLVRQDGALALAGDTGEIWLRSHSLLVEYLDNREATDKAIENGWYKTGDLARIDADGYLFIVDRLQDMIVSGGENVYSKEVEDALLLVGGIADCAVFGIPHSEWGETVAAVVVPVEASEIDEDELRAALRQHLAPYKIPRRIIVADALPRTPTGKVVKPDLRAKFGAA